MLHLLPFSSTLVTAAFAAAVLARYSQRGGTHLLFWGIGLILYGLGTFSEAYLGLAWSPIVLRMWYISGAMLTAAWLGQGTLYLLVRKPGVANVFAASLTLASILAIAIVFLAPMTNTLYHTGLPASIQYKAIMVRSSLMVTLTILLNIYGTVLLVGGALYSAFLFWRKRVLAHRVIANVLIAAGALMPATAGTFVKLGLADWLYLSELLGATIMFIGFLQATSPQPVQVTSPQTAG
jgi:hypothetical protein